MRINKMILLLALLFFVGCAEENVPRPIDSSSAAVSSSTSVSAATEAELMTPEEKVTMILSTIDELTPRQITLDSLSLDGRMTDQSEPVTFTISLPAGWSINNIVLECVMDNGRTWKLGEIDHPRIILNKQNPLQDVEDIWNKEIELFPAPLRHSEVIHIADNDAMLHVTAWEPVPADSSVVMSWHYPHIYNIAHGDYIYGVSFTSPVPESAELRAKFEEILSTIEFD